MPIPIPLILAVAELVPSVMRMFKGDKQAAVAEKVVDAAKVLTGNDDAVKAIEAIKANPELLVQIQSQAKDIALAELEAETAQQAQVNESMRAELSSSSLFKSGWRPYFGWSISTVFWIWVLAVVAIPIYMIVKHPQSAGEIITLTIQYVGAMMMIWAAAFAVLGVNINNRSRDKQVAAGLTPLPGILSLLGRR